MKTQVLKKLFLSFMAIVLVMGTIVMTNVYAEDSYTITISKKDEVEHKYEAYQIFDGDLYENPDDTETRKKTLANIEWGSGIDQSKTEELLAELKGDATIGEKFNECTSPREVAVVLEKFNEDEKEIKAFAQIIGKYLTDTKKCDSSFDGVNYTITVTDPGYYFIKDKTGSLKENDYAAYTRYILEVVGNVKINPKSEKPTIEKSLSENDFSKDTGDYAINQEFMYYLTANLPESGEYGEYNKYKLIFEDQMSVGISYDGIVSVKVSAKTNEESATEKNFELKVNEDYTEKTDTLEGNEKKLTITIDDLANILKKNNADITKGVKVVVSYKAHLNEKANISKLNPDTEGNKPNINTVKLKYSNNPNGTDESSMGTTVEDKNYVFTYEIDNTKYGRKADEPDTQKKLLQGAGFTLYSGEKPEEGKEISLKWSEELSAYYPSKDGDANNIIKSKDDGTFNIVGLDEGTYTLVEVQTPDGYNTCDNIKIVITPKFEDTESSSKTVTFTNSSNMVNTIVNIYGSRLPDTGSITLIIIFGVAIVLGITGLIISKNKKEE